MKRYNAIDQRNSGIRLSQAVFSFSRGALQDLVLERSGRVEYVSRVQKLNVNPKCKNLTGS
jgi:hypothetical protein